MSIETELNLIRREHGGVLDPSDVVDYARKNKSSELHGRFNWNVSEAAREHWLWQARQIIRVHVQVLDRGDGSTAPMRAYFNTADEPERGYRPTKPALSHEETRARIITAQLDRLESIL